MIELKNKITNHFYLEEYQCHCGECPTKIPDKKLSDNLEKVRIYFNNPIEIVSGIRCSKYNKEIGGAKDSQHIYCKAVDIRIKDFSNEKKHDLIKIAFQYFSGIGIGAKNGIFKLHLDVREEKTIWTY